MGLESRFNTLSIMLKYSGLLEGKSNNLLLKGLRSNPEFQFTSVEVERCKDEILKQFIRKELRIVPSIQKYGNTEAFEDFMYYHTKLHTYIKIFIFMYNVTDMIVESNSDLLVDFMDYEEPDYELLESEINISFELLYEQSLITLIALFEAYLNNLLEWIYRHDKRINRKLRALLSIEDIRQNTNNILDVIINYTIDNLSNWRKREDAFNRAPIDLSFSHYPQYKVMREANARRNALIHNKGKVDKRYNNTSLGRRKKIGTILTVDSKYFHEIDKNVLALIENLDKQVITKYAHQSK